MKMLTMALVAATLTLSGTSAFAQRSGQVQGEGAARTQEFNFTDELVQGQLVRPDGETSRVRRRSAGISLFRFR